MAVILVAEDNTEYRKLLAIHLKRAGYAVCEAADGLAALDVIHAQSVDAVVADIMMPRMDGMALLEQMRREDLQTPVLIVTAKEQFDAMRESFHRGADDYLVKPVRMEELLLRLEAILRRRGVSAGTREVTIGPYTLNEGTLCVEDAQKKTSVQLRLKEFRLLCKLAGHPGKIFTRQELMDDVWGYDSESDSRTVDTHVKRLREKLETLPEIRIQTVRGLGYRVEKIKS